MDNQKACIDFFLSQINNIFKIRTSILEYPDETIRNQKACDAVASIGKKTVAIEHTSIDCYQNQREENALFLKLFKPVKEALEKELKVPGKFDISTDSKINLKGFDYNKARPLIIKRCLEQAKTLKFGSPETAPNHFAILKIPEIPFYIKLCRWPGKNCVRLYCHSFEEIQTELMEVLNKAIKSRGEKVTQYKDKSYRTVLLIESQDIQLTNDAMIRQAFFKITKDVSVMELPDEVYLILTGFPDYELYCVKFDKNCSFETNNIYKREYLKIYQE